MLVVFRLYSSGHYLIHEGFVTFRQTLEASCLSKNSSQTMLPIEETKDG